MCIIYDLHKSILSFLSIPVTGVLQGKRAEYEHSPRKEDGKNLKVTVI